MPVTAVASVLFEDTTGKLEALRISTLVAEQLERPPAETIQQAASILEASGFRIEARTKAGLSFSGTREQFEVQLGWVPVDASEDRGIVATTAPGDSENSLPVHEPGPQPLWGKLAEAGVSGLEKPPSAIGAGPVLIQGYDVDDVPALLGLTPFLAKGIGRGEGVHVCVVDSGIWSRSLELVWMDPDGLDGNVHYPIAQFHAAWSDVARTHPLEADAGDGTAFRLRKASNAWMIYVDYSHVAPGFPTITCETVADLDRWADEDGHGTAVVAHLRAVAPKCDVTMVKAWDLSGIRNHPVAAFQRAVEQAPDVILCSWVMAWSSVALQIEIASAVKSGIAVVFAAGNGRDTNDSNWTPPEKVENVEGLDVESATLRAAKQVASIAHPDALCVGGAHPTHDENDALVLEATKYSARCDSEVFTSPARHVPDVVGLMASLPEEAGVLPGLFLTPTALGSCMDLKPIELGSPATVDGVVVTGGTSMAAAHAAGFAALLVGEARKQGHELRPEAVKNLLMCGARDVTKGASDAPHWDRATGWGLVSPNSFRFLGQGTRVLIRSHRWDADGANRNFTTNSSSSPDIIVSRAVGHPQYRFGLAARHLDGRELGDPTSGSCRIYVRVQNPSLRIWEGAIRVYAAGPGGVQLLLSNDATLEPGCFWVEDCGTLASPPSDTLLVVAGPTEPPNVVNAGSLAAFIRSNPNAAIRWAQEPS